MSHCTETTTQKAKKTHRCTWCWQLIEPGEEYKRYRFFDNGDAGTVKMHPECFDAMQEEAAEWGYGFEWTPGQERPAKGRRQHITDGGPCWCNPETTYTDPDTGGSVIVHRDPQ